MIIANNNDLIITEGRREAEEGPRVLQSAVEGVFDGLSKSKRVDITDQCCNSVPVILLLRGTSCASVNAILLLLVLQCLLHKSFIIEAN